MKEKNIIHDIVSEIEKIDFIEIFKAIRPVLICYITSRSVNNYILHRRHKPANYLKVYIPEEIEKKHYNVSDIDIEKVYSLKFNEQLRYFTKGMTENFKEEDLQNFFNNINSLKIETIKKKKSKFHNYYTIGTYDTDINTVYITNETADIAIYHELFHMASTKMDDDNVTRTGFHYINKHGNVGIGINEGYTYLLSKRYFEDSKYGYNYELVIAEKLEEIIDKEKMESLYLNANLYGLINELRQYEDEKEIMKFIYNIDFITSIVGDKKRNSLGRKYLQDSIYSASDFLIRCYFKKRLNEFDNGMISYEVLESSIFNYIEELDLRFKIEKEKYNYINKDSVIDTMNSVIESDNRCISKRNF